MKEHKHVPITTAMIDNWQLEPEFHEICDLHVLNKEFYSLLM